LRRLDFLGKGERIPEREANQQERCFHKVIAWILE
jgi:hypothetical protein